MIFSDIYTPLQRKKAIADIHLAKKKEKNASNKNGII